MQNDTHLIVLLHFGVNSTQITITLLLYYKLMYTITPQ